MPDETGELDEGGGRSRWQRLVLQHPDVHAERYWPAYGALGAAVVLQVRKLLRGLDADGRTLILSALAIWVTNVIVFALWFWEFDGGGPVPRRANPDGRRDFLFPQIQLQQDETEVLARDAELVELGKLAQPRQPKYVGWLPDFVDYFYVSFTNATAFSPTDTMPLSRWAKMLMLVQSGAALLTVALIAARAVNILK